MVVEKKDFGASLLFVFEKKVLPSLKELNFQVLDLTDYIKQQTNYQWGDVIKLKGTKDCKKWHHPGLGIIWYDVPDNYATFQHAKKANLRMDDGKMIHDVPNKCLVTYRPNNIKTGDFLIFTDVADHKYGCHKGTLAEATSASPNASHFHVKVLKGKPHGCHESHVNSNSVKKISKDDYNMANDLGTTELGNIKLIKDGKKIKKLKGKFGTTSSKVLFFPNLKDIEKAIKRQDELKEASGVDLKAKTLVKVSNYEDIKVTGVEK